MLILCLAVASLLAWFISALAGGGSPLVLIPVVNFFLEAAAVAPVITIGMLLGNAQRALLFWQHIDWKMTRWYLPGAIAGALLGAYTFTQIQVEWVQILIGLFLLATVLSYSLNKQERTFTVQTWQFLPAGFFHAFISGLVGSSGPVMNPFYLNYGLVKEQMLATKAVHVIVVHIAKLFVYAAFGVLKPEYLGYGLVIGLAAAPATWAGQYILQKMSDRQFRQLVMASMAIAGVLMLWEQRDLMTFWQGVH
jgi:hypothetical protein